MRVGKYIRTPKIKEKNRLSLLGRKLPEKVKAKISLAHKGIKFSEERKKKIGEGNKGKILSEETKKKISLANHGKIRTQETREKIKRATKGKINLNEKNGNWKGENIKKENGADGLHDWIRRRKSKPELCEECKKIPPYDLSNISGKYKRDINDFRWLCRKCHMLSDGRLKCPTH